MPNIKPISDPCHDTKMLNDGAVGPHTFIAISFETEARLVQRRENVSGHCDENHIAAVHFAFKTAHIFRCEMGTAPLLKANKTGGNYFERVSLSIQQEVVKATASTTIRLRKSTVVYMNHRAPDPPYKQPY